MDRLADFLQAIGYHAVMIQPLLLTNFHLIVSALFPIYAGAHASLSRPSSAGRAPKRKKQAHDNEDEKEDGEEESEQKMEGMSPLDAIALPLLAGSTLAGLYFLIKWLENPAILNTVLNWYFSIFGVFALARLITDVMGTITSIIFPSMYTLGGQAWTINGKERKAELSSVTPESRDSPLPGRLSTLPLPKTSRAFLWTLRELTNRRLHIRFHIHSVAHGEFALGPHGLLSFLLALIAQLYFNFIAKPWYLTNALGFSLAYNALQILSPTTLWTGTLILSALFLYDIYFVFYTPLMVTVASTLDIPAKLLFPRPHGAKDDATKQSLSMLGLGDIVLPGIMVGFALRFDLYLFYLRKQTEQTIPFFANFQSPSLPSHRTETIPMQKDTYYPATSGWGERLWTSRRALVTSPRYHGIVFPKTYFHATLAGYVVGMLATLVIMQIFHRAQPALLYLVPGVLGALWGSALVNGDLKALWAYAEVNGEEEGDKEEEETADKDSEAAGRWTLSNLRSVLLEERVVKKPERRTALDRSGEKWEGPEGKVPEMKGRLNGNDSKSRGNHPISRDRRREILFFSVTLPNAPPHPSAISTHLDVSRGENEASKSRGERVEDGVSRHIDPDPQGGGSL